MKDAKKRETGVSMPTKSKQAEEERLLLESSRHVTRTATALFYGNGFIVSALPLCTYFNVFAWGSGEGGGKERRGAVVDYNKCMCKFLHAFSGLYWRVMALDPVTYAPLFAVVTLSCTYLVSEAYKKTKISLKHKLALAHTSTS